MSCIKRILPLLAIVFMIFASCAGSPEASPDSIAINSRSAVAQAGSVGSLKEPAPAAIVETVVSEVLSARLEEPWKS